MRIFGLFLGNVFQVDPFVHSDVTVDIYVSCEKFLLASIKSELKFPKKSRNYCCWTFPAWEHTDPGEALSLW